MGQCDKFLLYAIGFSEDAKKDLIEQGFAVAGELAGENAQLSKGVAVAQTVAVVMCLLFTFSFWAPGPGHLIAVLCGVSTPSARERGWR